MPYKHPTDEIRRYKTEYTDLTDDELLGKLSEFRPSAPQHIAAKTILKQRDPTRETIADLADRIANIERTATRHAFKTWTFWLALSALIVATATLAAMLWQWSLQP